MPAFSSLLPPYLVGLGSSLAEPSHHIPVLPDPWRGQHSPTTHLSNTKRIQFYFLASLLRKWPDLKWAGHNSYSSYTADSPGLWTVSHLQSSIQDSVLLQVCELSSAILYTGLWKGLFVSTVLKPLPGCSGHKTAYVSMLISTKQLIFPKTKELIKWYVHIITQIRWEEQVTQ